MKSNIFKLSALPLALGLLLSGCSSDNPMAEPEKPLERTTDFYMNVKIATPVEGGTRGDNTNTSANDYVNGTREEQEIHKILFVFYNSDYQYVGNSTFTPATYTAPVDKDVAGSIETILNITVPVTVAAGSTKPAYVMAYVNPTNRAMNDLLTDYNSALGAFRTLDDVIEIKDGKDAHEGFAMNNSVHYEAQKDEELPTIATPIDSDKLFTSAKDAEAAQDKSVVIYVERIVAKVTLDKDKNNWTDDKDLRTVTDEKGVDKYRLDFNILGWGLSNLEQATFLVKNFRTEISGNPSIDQFDDLMTFSNFKYKELNDRLSTQGGLTNPHWNFPGNSTASEGTNWGISGHRTFWALSPTYYRKGVSIPVYADEIYTGKEGGDPDMIPNLVYRTFNDIYNTNTEAVGAHGTAFGETLYTLEHTMQASLVTDYQKRAVTCAVVVGKYDMYKNDVKVENFGNFYIRKKMTETGHVSEIFPSDDAMMAAFLNANFTICVKDGENYNAVKYKEEYEGDFEIIHPRKDITGDSYVASRYVTLKLKETAVDKYYYRNPSGQWVLIDADNLQNANQDLYTNMIGVIGGIEMYKDGYAYFEIPIKHLWTLDKEGNEYPGIGQDKFQAHLGQYGIVRNHCYNINVQGITGLGIGISDPDAPIVPNVDNDDYVVKTEIRVQRWRVVPTQNVTLRQ